jgi:hypothetical protein
MTPFLQYYRTYDILNHTLQIRWVQNQGHQEVQWDQIEHPAEHPYLDKFIVRYKQNRKGTPMSVGAVIG